MKKITLSLVTGIVLCSSTLLAKSYPAYGPNSYKALHSGKNKTSKIDFGWYLGLGYSFMRDNSEFQITNGSLSGSDNLDGNLATLIAGLNIHPNLAIEARYNILVGDISTSFGNFNMDYSNLSFFLKPKVQIEKTTLYGLIGYGQSKVDYYGFSNTDEDFQWGFGASYPINEKTDVFIDYTNVYDKEGTTGNIQWKDNIHLFNFGLNIFF